MNVTFLHRGIILDGGVPLGLEEIAGQILVALEGCVNLELPHYILVDGIHIFVEFERFIGGVAQAPGAREIVEVAAARLAGENIEDDGLPQAKYISHSVSPSAKIVQVGDDVYVDVTARCDTVWSYEGGISVSVEGLPKLDDANGKVSGSSSTMKIRTREYGGTEKIHHIDNGFIGATHVLVEGYVNTWKKGDTHTLRVKITPKKVKDLTVRVRTWMGTRDDLFIQNGRGSSRRRSSVSSASPVVSQGLSRMTW